MSNIASEHNQIPHVPEHVVKFNLYHCCDAITTLITPILLAVAISLTIYYAVHPVAPLIPIYGNFSLSLPILICGSTGLALAIVLIVQVARRGKIKIACGQYLSHQIHFSPKTQQQIRTIVHSGGRPENQTIEQFRKENINKIDAVTADLGPQVTFQTRDGVMLSGYWHESEYDSVPTVIFFHGNNMSAESAAPWGELYKMYFHCNFLLVEYRGYGISGGVAAGPNAELEAYYDAEAALQFVCSKNVDESKIIAHGYSLGGAYAAALGYFFHVPFVVLQNAFLDLTCVATHASKIVPIEMIKPSITAAYKEGSSDPLTIFPTARPLHTDCFNNLKKVQGIIGKILVIQGIDDHLIAEESGKQFVEARYKKKEKQEAHLITVQGGHNFGSLLRKENTVAFGRFKDFVHSVSTFESANLTEGDKEFLSEELGKEGNPFENE